MTPHLRVLRASRPVATSLYLVSVLALGACSGSIPGSGDDPKGSSGGKGGSDGETPGDGQPGGGSSGGPNASGPCSEAAGAAQPGLRLIGPGYYKAAVGKLLGGSGSKEFPSDVEVPLAAREGGGDRYGTYASTATISDSNLSGLVASSAQLAHRYVQGLKLSATCTAADGQFGGCAREIADKVAPIIFRRPGDDDTLAPFTTLAVEARATETPQASLALMVQAMLSAPEFLFHSGIGRAGSGEKLDSFEIADHLASVLSDAPPDAELWAAAEADQLGSSEQIRPHVLRYLGDGKAQGQTLTAFMSEWFQLRGVLDVFKEEKFHKPDALLTNSQSLIGHLVATNGRKGFLQAALTTQDVFVDKATAESFGVDGGSLTDTASKLQVPTRQRVGLLTQPAWLSTFAETAETAPVKRGKFVREEILCQHVPDLPIGDIPLLPEGPRPMREKLKVHTEQASCRGCHATMDPLGLAFEIYDHVGRYRSEEFGKPIDAAGELTDTDDADGPFTDARDLIERISTSKTAQRCLATQVFRYFAARAEKDFDGCAIEAAAKAFADSNGDPIEAVIAVLSADSFKKRSPMPASGEVKP